MSLGKFATGIAVYTVMRGIGVLIGLVILGWLFMLSFNFIAELLSFSPRIDYLWQGVLCVVIIKFVTGLGGSR